jgi:hypothetical protein
MNPLPEVVLSQELICQMEDDVAIDDVDTLHLKRLSYSG